MPASFSLLVLLVTTLIVTTSGSGTCRGGTRPHRFMAAVSGGEEDYPLLALPQTLAVCEPGTQGDDHILKGPTFDKGEPQKWTKVADREIYVFSAFYETRKEADGPAVRVIACGLQEQFNEIGDLFCHLWYENNQVVIAVKALYHRIYPSLAHGDMWVSHFILCPLPTARTETPRVVPYAVGIVPAACHEAVPHHLMVLNRHPPGQRGQHALCVSPLYGFFKNWTMVAEMFEIQTLLGAEAITIFQYSVTPQTRHLLETYLEDTTMKVDVVQWSSFPRLKSNVWCQRGALNDCLYRMGAHYEYVTVTDLDEILVPRAAPTWPSLMPLISRPDIGPLISRPDIGAFLFQHAYFRRNYTEQSVQAHRLITQSSFWRTDKVLPPGKIRCKSMYKAKLAVSIDLHFPYSLVPGAREYILDPEEGILHHYRAYPMESFIKHPENYLFIEDRHMELYKEDLERRFEKRARDARERF